MELDDRRRYRSTCKAPVAMDTNVNTHGLATCSASSTCDGDCLIALALTNHTIAIYEGENLNKINTLKGHAKTITGLKFSKSDPNVLYSSSLDGTIRIWDLKQGRSVQQFQDDSGGKRKTMSSFDVSCNGAFVTGGTEAIITDVFLLFWDIRSPKLLGGYSDSHTDDITQVRFHPEKPNTMASGSTDGLINIFDISQPCEDDALQNTLNTESSVDILRWCQRGSSIACLTHVETVQLWDVENVEITKSFDRESIAKELKMVLPPTQFVNLETNENTGLPTLVATCKENNAILIEVEDGYSLTRHSSLGRIHKSPLVCATWDAKDEWALTVDESALICYWKSEKETEDL